MDKLPMHLQNRVLEEIEVDEDGNITAAKVRAKLPKPRTHVHAWAVVAAVVVLLVWSIPLTLVGIICILSVLLAPFGPPIMVLGGVPLAHLIWKAFGTETHEVKTRKSNRKTP